MTGQIRIIDQAHVLGRICLRIASPPGNKDRAIKLACGDPPARHPIRRRLSILRQYPEHKNQNHSPHGGRHR